MQRFSRLAIFPAGLLFVASVVSAQGRTQNYPPSQITGVVRKQVDNTPVQHIKVQVNASDGEPMDTHYTNSDGSFAFGMVPQGTYVVTINEEGYQPYREEIDVLGFPGIRLNIALREVVKDKPPVKGDVVSSRELALPGKAQEALHKGIDALFQKRDPAGSLPYFKAVLDAAPDFYEANYYQGVAQLKSGHKEDAEASFRKCIASSQDQFPEVYFALASLLADQGRFSEAETIDRKGLQLQPEAWRGHYELARVLLGTNRPSEAEESALEASKRVKNYPQLFLLLANIHLRLLKNEAVIEDLNAYLKLDPTGAYSDEAKAMKEKAVQAIGHTPGPLTQRP